MDRFVPREDGQRDYWTTSQARRDGMVKNGIASPVPL